MVLVGRQQARNSLLAGRRSSLPGDPAAFSAARPANGHLATPSPHTYSQEQEYLESQHQYPAHFGVVRTARSVVPSGRPGMASCSPSSQDSRQGQECLDLNPQRRRQQTQLTVETSGSIMQFSTLATDLRPQRSESLPEMARETVESDDTARRARSSPRRRLKGRGEVGFSNRAADKGRGAGSDSESLSSVTPLNSPGGLGLRGDSESWIAALAAAVEDDGAA